MDNGAGEETKSYAETYRLTADDVANINALNESAPAASSAGPSFRAP
nr:S2P [synthetic construct]